ncbi:hypothetical protein JIO05_03145 [Pediococcus acidilactici]|uniref:hypothetical protein n=1 Tax=Pediococcus acidilactici TaxID=1254 RepID=UPI0019135B58|nr:hypothetical protein [Pediococcus acidilactici]QQP83921.1 hypothetical protein JIO05_03145 [Pediococcus acidilactici]
MDFKDFLSMDNIEKVKLVRSYIRQAGFENPDQYIGVCMAVIGQFNACKSDNEIQKRITEIARYHMRGD